MSKLIIKSTTIPLEILYLDANTVAQAFIFPYSGEDHIIGTDRYTLDHEHALKQGDNEHASN